jgi:hypothetical protein
MIILNLGENSEMIRVTPLENSATTPAFYYFLFVNRITNDEVDMWLTNVSTTARYQKFQINTENLFGDYDTGFWSYTIQGASVNNVVPTTPILESGYMYLYPETEFNPTEYNEQSNQFKTYNG